MQDKAPTQELVDECWKTVVYHSSREDAAEVRHLSLNEKKLLIAIANGITSNLTSKASLSKINLASSSVARAIETLQKKDLIDKTKDAYYIVNPALATQAIQEG
jgi:DNA-binding MarR family transcriptional regulator